MIGKYLEAMLVSVSASMMTEIIIWLMIIIFIMAAIQGKSGKHGAFLEHAPAVLVSIGILGTFIGIVIGLLGFDAHDIKNSIEGLLGGLKTAFITSLVGMTLSIALKAMDTWWFAAARNKQDDAPDEVTSEHIYTAMSRQVQLLEGMNRSLSGNEEGSIAGQLKLLRADMGDFRTVLSREHKEFKEALFEQLTRFSEMLSRSATEVVIEALRQVIQDFNKQLVEQFGDNFKSLNDSVVKMIDWQELYKQHVETLEGRIEIAVRELERTATANEAISRALVVSEQSIGSIEGHCQNIPETIAQLKPVLQTNQHQIQELQRHLDAFVVLRDQAARAVPELQQHMDKLSQALAEKMTGVATMMHEGAMEFGRSVDRTNTALTEASHVVSSQSEQMGQNMKDAADGFGSSVRSTLDSMVHNSQSFEQRMAQAIDHTTQTLADEFKRVTAQIHGSLVTTVDATMASMRSTVENNINQTESQIQGSANRTLGAVEAQVREATERANASLQAQLNAMDQAIGRELEKVFREMGSALATISRRIADDHAELTQRVRVQ